MKLKHKTITICMAIVFIIHLPLLAQSEGEDKPEKEHPKKMHNHPDNMRHRADGPEGIDHEGMRNFRKKGAKRGKHGKGPEGKRPHKSWGQSLEEALENEAIIISFLNEYVPKMAEKLLELKNNEDNKRKYNHQLVYISNLYSAAIKIKDKNSPLTKVLVNNITQKLKIQNAIHKFRKAEDDVAKTKAKANLKTQLNKMFDVTISLEAIRYEQMSKMSKIIIEHNKNNTKKQSGKVKEKKHKPKKGERHRRIEDPESFEKKLNGWKADKEKIVNIKLEQLLNKMPPFPWDRL